MSFLDICERYMAHDPFHWWKTNQAELPQWASAAKVVLLLQPLSAVSETVFSILWTLLG